MPTNDYQEKSASYAKHEIQGTLKLAYKEFGRIFKTYLKEGTLALDYGCGTGRSARYLKDLGFKVDGVDIDKSMLDKAQETSKDISYSLIVGGKIPIRNSKYDIVFSTLVLLEIPTLQQMTVALQEIYRVTKLNSTVVLLTVNDNFYSHNWVSVDTNFPENRNPKSGQELRVRIKEINLVLHDYYWTRQDYRQVFTNTHFEIIEEILPRADKQDRDTAWLDETEHAPYVIFVLKKRILLTNIKKIADDRSLLPYGDGVYFKETERSTEIIKQKNLPTTYSGDRNVYSKIELLIGANKIIPFHRLISREIYQHLYGTDLTLHLIDDEGNYTKVLIGQEADKATKKFTISPGVWQGVEVEDEQGFSIVTAQVEPGFNPDDTESCDLQKLAKVTTNPYAIKVLEKFMLFSNNKTREHNRPIVSEKEQLRDLRSRL